jgi:uncharacterized protein (DUF924 family)
MIPEEESCQAVLDFWFGPAAAGKWFAVDESFDAAIRTRFLPLWERAARQELDGWAASANGALALILVLDQFPRNMFRGTPRAFATDARARGIADLARERGFDLAVPDDRRMFFYLPFEHAEDLACQRLCVELCARHLPEGDLQDYARRHHDIIARFGRFPHRNAILGRVSTPEEAAFLKEPGSAF